MHHIGAHDLAEEDRQNDDKTSRMPTRMSPTDKKGIFNMSYLFVSVVWSHRSATSTAFGQDVRLSGSCRAKTQPQAPWQAEYLRERKQLQTFSNEAYWSCH
ncbi:MAG: hypothetical protein H6782_00920 [Candidatus Nomurabacteria bacterium]|nr:MAG: hypothetical protein H6782_00920 [Candidatus Nomurabacteria bacterium]